jgi:hypothetical protein
MLNYLKWWMVLAGCVVASMVVVPIAIAFRAAAKALFDLSDHAQLQLRLHAMRKGRTS